MTVVANMLSENTIININNELNSLTELFKHNGWNKIKNNDKLSDHITYSKEGNETEFFKIELNNNIVYVSVPLKNSTFQYKTKFADYYSAIKYTESKFYYFIENENICF
jgi:hemolysin activation/secretion protein